MNAAGVTEVLSVCRVILNVVSTMDDIKENWFLVTEECKGDVRLLRSRLQFYAMRFGTRPLPDYSSTMIALENSKATLKRMEERLLYYQKLANSKECHAFVWSWIVRLDMTVTPGKLQTLIKKVTEEVGKIPKILQEEEETESLLQKWDKRQANPTEFYDNDGLYVSIQKSEKEIIEAIEDVVGPPIILLHGGVGKGKSILGRRMCERYGKYGEKENMFDFVIDVMCGDRTIFDIQKEILQNVSPASLDTSGKEGAASSSKDKIFLALHQVLSEKKILIILDDISKERIVYEMWKAAKSLSNVKYLVTSQMANLCNSLTAYSVCIAMGDPLLNEAKMILASLVGLRDEPLGPPIIPPHLEVIADRIIKATEGNPLALACLASYFPNRHRRDKQTWQEVYDTLDQRLNDVQTKIVLGQSDETRRSLWSAMKLCIDSLETKDAKVILFILYACKKGSVPEVVLRILHAIRKTSSNAFTRSKEELFTREFLKPSPRTLAPMDEELRPHLKEHRWGTTGSRDEEFTSCSLGSLWRRYMNNFMSSRKEFRSVIGTLLIQNNIVSKYAESQNEPAEVTKDGKLEIAQNEKANRVSQKLEVGNREKAKGSHGEGEIVQSEKPEVVFESFEVVAFEMSGDQSEKAKVATALCALYFDELHTDPVVVDVATQARHASNLSHDSKLNYVKLMTIEPIIWLLDQPEEDDGKWTGAHVRYTRQMFLKYVCENQLDGNSISDLLKLKGYPLAQVATLEAITRICYIGENALLSEESLSFLEDLVELFNTEGLKSIPEAALKALSSLSWKAAKEKSVSAKLKIANQKGTLALLTKYLDDKNPDLQYTAAKAFVNLAYGEGDPLRLKILNEQGALANLLKVMENNPNSQENREKRYSSGVAYYAAAKALVSLARGAKDELKLKFLNEKGTVPALLKLLKEGEGYLQEQAAMALANLSCGGSSIKSIIVNETKALSCFVEFLACDEKPVLQEWAALALRNLSRT